MIIDKINEYARSVFARIGYGTDENVVVVSARPDLCDYQCNKVFDLSKKFKKSPQIVADEFLTEARNCTLFEKVEFAPPGFINFTLAKSVIGDELARISKSERLGVLQKNDKIVIDYGGPNVAKPLHVGHLRSAIVGESIKRILCYGGNKVTSDTHLGDFGLQIGQVIYGIMNEGLTDFTIFDLDRIYPQASELCKSDPVVQEKCKQITKALQDGDPEYRGIWKKILELSKADIKQQYDYLDVHFDLWEGESDAYTCFPELEKAISKYIEESEGAAIINLGDGLPPLVYKSSAGSYLYASTDLATIYKRAKLFAPSRMIYVVDKRQSLHFRQVFTACELAGIFPKDSLCFCGFGMVNGSDGRPFKTRSGGAPKLRELFSIVKDALAKIPQNENASSAELDIMVGATVKFADLQNTWERDYAFDIDKFSQASGKTGPYILYTYARMNSILQGQNIVQNFQIFNEFDRALCLHLSRYPETFARAHDELSPSIIATYLYNLCEFANAFYTNNHIKNNQNKNQADAWLCMTSLACRVLKVNADLLGITVLERMTRKT